MPQSQLRIVAWELTQKCNLSCDHCRADAVSRKSSDELPTEVIKEVLKDIKSFANPVIILSGGEALTRPDIYEIVEYCAELKLKTVLGTNATLFTPENVKRFKDAGLIKVAVSLDCSYAGDESNAGETEDVQSGLHPGYEQALAGIELCKKAGLPFQINTTITKRNADDLRSLIDMGIKLGAHQHQFFFLMPTGRGKEIESEAVSTETYERVLKELLSVRKELNSKQISHIDEREKHYSYLRITCAPDWIRFIDEDNDLAHLSMENKRKSMDGLAKGCPAGSSFAFISKTGEVNPCGFFPLNVGNITETSFRDIWENAEELKAIRDPSRLEGRCGMCEYQVVCGGCRARHWFEDGNYLGDDSRCSYIPHKVENLPSS